MEEDNLLLRNHQYGKGEAALIGKPVKNEQLKKLLNITDTAAKNKNVNFFVKQFYKPYLEK